jgi:hypothetical protein
MCSDFISLNEGADVFDTDILCRRIVVSYLSDSYSTLDSIFLCKGPFSFGERPIC